MGILKCHEIFDEKLNSFCIYFYSENYWLNAMFWEEEFELGEYENFFY